MIWNKVLSLITLKLLPQKFALREILLKPKLKLKMIECFIIIVRTFFRIRTPL